MGRRSSGGAWTTPSCTACSGHKEFFNGLLYPTVTLFIIDAVRFP
jgi:hypothetical protein